jgi:hypothetical protein
MEYKIIYRGLDVICDSPEALDALADHHQSRAKGLLQESTNGNPQQNGHSKSMTLPQFIEALGDKAQKLLRTLANADGRVKEADVRHALGYKTTNQLSGLISVMSRHAARNGLDADTFLGRSFIDNDPKNKVTDYFIKPEALSQVREGLGLKG